MGELLRRFVHDDSAQDVVEYAYLAAFVSVAGIVVWASIVALLGDHYEAVNDGVQDLWEYAPPDLEEEG